MDLLIEAAAPGLPGLPLTTGSGETAPQDAAFGDLLQTLLSAGAQPPAESPPQESVDALPLAGEAGEAPSEDDSSGDSLDDALAAALALLSLGLAPLASPLAASPGTPPEAGDDAPEAIASTASPAASPVEPPTEAGGESAPLAEAAPPGEDGTDAPDGAPPGDLPPDAPAPAGSSLEETPPPTDQQSVVRLVGNASTASGDDSQPPRAGLDSGQPSSPLPAAPLQPHPAVAPVIVADAPVSTAAPLPLPPVAQVAHAVIERVADGGGDVRLRLDPPDLGEILIHVTVDGGDVRVDVHADNADAARLLRDATPNLSTLLSDRGLGLADVSVGHGGRDNSQQAFGQESFGRQGRHDDGAFAALMGIDGSPESRQFNRIRATYNPDGAYLYRV